MKSFTKNISFAVLVFSLFSANALAQGVRKLDTPTPLVGTLFEFVTAVLGIVIKICIPVVVIFLILSGYYFVTAEGDPKRLDEAKKMFLGSVVGATILLCAVVIATLIKNTIDQLGG